MTSGVWVTCGFDDFVRGTCGNAGQNLYVSRAGVLQRIHQYDLNKDGYFDLLFCNSQNHWEKPDAYVYRNVLGDVSRLDLPSDGAMSGAVADLNGDGYDDLVLGMYYNGITRELNAFIYFGGPDGWSESRQQLLPAPSCTAVAAGDFAGSGAPALAFLCDGKLRVFYQTALGFEPKRFTDLEVEGEHLAAGDLDGDGCDDLLVCTESGEVRIYWGGEGGIHADRCTLLPALAGRSAIERVEEDDSELAKYAEWVNDAKPLVRAIRLGNRPHVFIPQADRVMLIPVSADRTFGAPLALDCPRAMAADVGDINGDSYPDLVFACRQPHDDGESSWVYWGAADGFSDERRTRLGTWRACDVAVGDLDGNGCADVVFCQNQRADSFTADSLVYRGAPGGIAGRPVELTGEDARRVFIARPSPAGDPQIVFVNHFSRGRKGNVNAYVYPGGADGFQPDRRLEIPAWGAVEGVCCDVNDDGWVDVVLANASENSVRDDPGSFVVLNGPGGFSDTPSIIVPTRRAHGVCCADLNRDGYLDVAFCGFDNPDITIFYGTPDGFDTEHPAVIKLADAGKERRDPRWVYLADLDNNGWLDLVVPMIADDHSFILWGGPDGFSMERSQTLAVVRAGCARAADLSGNGYLDLIMGGHMPDHAGPHDSFVYIYWNGPDGLREDNRTILPAKTINAMAVADFNNNGLLDLFICSYHAVGERDIDSYIYWNRPGRGFSAADRHRMFTHSASGCVAADFNEDGWVDLAIAYHKVWGDHIGYSGVWWNGPDGFDERRVTTLPTVGPHGMTAVGTGNIADRGPEEFYSSAPFALPDGARLTQIWWEAETPAKTWVKAQIRVAPTKETLADAPWIGPAGEESWFENAQGLKAALGVGKWVQYRLALGATNSLSTPRVTEVRLSYRVVALVRLNNASIQCGFACCGSRPGRGTA